MHRSGPFESQPHTRARGRVGEDDAVAWLTREHGYRVVERNVTNKAGEIDLVAHDGETLCFLEIKARASATYGPAIEAVPPSKQRRIGRAASLYLALHPTDAPCRFDVVAMDRVDGRWRFQLVRDAFMIPG
jgi:putative endonuclease